VSPLRPDLVECWVFRLIGPRLEILLIRRAAGRPFAGMWQCVTGRLEAGESVVSAALREVAEETALVASDVEAVYSLDLVNAFFEASVDGILVEPVFAVRVAEEARPELSDEHDALRWSTPAEARTKVVWPAHLTAIGRLEALVADPAREPWFRLRPDGSRMVD
jgi:8-oxo-dGTP pyrophosphatase MutT (NUDIX family)